MRKEEQETILINLDGATVSEQLLETMAVNADRFDVAEHYLLAYYRQVVMENGLGHHVALENRVRTMSNFARCVDYEDRFEAYYDMEANPWKELCDVYWNILKGQILMK